MKSPSLLPKAICAIFLFVTIASPMSARAGEMRVLHGHVPEAEALSQPLGRLPGTNALRMAISLPLRNQDALAALLQRLYDPASADYHHYLTPAQFNERFGPTAQDYQTVRQFAAANGMTVTTHDSRLLLDIQGKASDVETAFHVTLQTYQHPSESRQFYAPDVEPSVDASLPAFNVVGLGDYAMPRPMLHRKAAGTKPVSASGSQASGYYLGKDFRNAYVPGVSLNGAGQMVGLLELDSYYTSDITAYESLAGYTNVPLVNVNVDSANGTPGSGVAEVSLDIEMAIAMAPGLGAVVVFEAGSGTSTTGFLDILDSMAASNQIKQFSSSWGFTGVTETSLGWDAEFQKMATEGQSFYQASGDGDAWYKPIWAPADSPYLTSVGGTQLTMNGSGASYASETVWNLGNVKSEDGTWSPNGNGYWGSGGGISSVYSIPSWQVGISNSSNHASSTMRNIPDVALTADDIWVIYDNNQTGAFGGTSCAAPLWAGFTALVNQQAAASGDQPVGFINPAVYAIGAGAGYTNSFHDITTGNNTNASSHNLWFAETGFDLCDGWGTPNGAGMINALVSNTVPEPLQITPSAGFVSSGNFGGPFSVTNQSFTLTNAGATSLHWSLVNTTLWLTASLSNGTLAADTAATVNIGLNANATNVGGGAYTNTVLFFDTNDFVWQSRQFILTVSKLTPVLNWSNPAAITYGAALTSSQLDATANVPGNFVYNPASGTVLTVGARTLSVTFTPSNTAGYNSATDSVSLTVSPAPLSATASNATRHYGATNPVFTGTLTGVQNSDNITATYSCSAMTNSALGPYAITPALVDPNNRQTNYIVSLTNGTLTVTVATPVLTWTTPSAITYGTALSSNQFDATANTSGTFNYNPSNGMILNKGTNVLSVLFTPSDNVDYSSATDSVNLVVSPALLTVTASNANSVYGQTLPAFTGTITGVTNGDNITAAYSCSATNGSPAGTYPIVPSLVDPANRQTNYTVKLTNGTLTITRAVPLLSWTTPDGITYGTALGSNQLDAMANTPGSFNYSPSDGIVLDTGTNILSVLFTPSDTVDYTNATDNVNLVVSPAPLIVTASDTSQVYGQTNPAFTGTIAGVTNGDDITAAYNCSATNNSPVGMYPIVPSLVDPADRQTNYIVSLTNGTFTITMATPLLNWTTPSAITYGTALGSNQLDAMANTPGSFNYTPTAGTVLGPGSNTLSVLFIPDDMVDYANATDSVSLVVSLVPIALNIQLAGTNVILSWDDPASVFSLQTAPAITGVFTNVPGASSPYTNAITGGQQFFQLVAPATP